MGKAILAAASQRPGLCVASVWTRQPATAIGAGEIDGILVSADLDSVVAAADVLIDFSLPDAFERIAEAAATRRRPLVCGVSGLNDPQKQLLGAVAGTIPVVYDRNMSLGIAVLDRLVRQAVAALGPEFEVLVEETHHVHKVDAPSGTALKLGESIAEARGQRFADVYHYDPDASVPTSAAGAVCFRVERRGEVPGEHRVTLASPTESLTLGHSVTTRQVFAEGALRAAHWVVDQAPGLYGMQHVLFGLER